MDIDVRTQQGVVRGRMDEGVASFKGIPYAAPPFGANRFQPPGPAERWNGVREAHIYGPTAPKPGYFPPFDVLFPDPAIPGEDCLNLNIWTPAIGRTGLLRFWLFDFLLQVQQYFRCALESTGAVNAAPQGVNFLL